MPDRPDKIHSSPTGTAWDVTRAELARDVDRVADRARGLSEARLRMAAPPHASRAAAARATAQSLADASAGIEASREAGGAMPVWRELPELGDFAVGDQVAVTGHDLVAAAHRAAPDDLAWTRDGRRTAHEVLDGAAQALAALRRLL